MTLADERPGNSDIPQFDHKIFDDAVEYLHGKKGFTIEMLADNPVKALMRETARVLTMGVTSSITASMSDTLKSRLIDDVRIFSGFKTINEMEQAASLLLDDRGRIKSFDTFLRDVRKIDETYNERYLRAEYDLSIASAQMAERWESFDEDDLLQYCTAGDDKVRAAHRLLEGITLPKSDSYWDGGMPPLNYGCRCTAKAVSKRKHKPSNHDDAVKLLEDSFTDAGKSAAIFRFNPGKDELVFPSRHPYYKVAEREEIAKIIKE